MGGFKTNVNYQNQGGSMSKELALSLIELLSALESAYIISNQSFPDYLHDAISNSMDELRAIVLRKEERAND